MGICELLTVIFVVCKILGLISWGWWLVFIPIYVAIAIYVVILAIVVLGVICS